MQTLVQVKPHRRSRSDGGWPGIPSTPQRSQYSHGLVPDLSKRRHIPGHCNVFSLPCNGKFEACEQDCIETAVLPIDRDAIALLHQALPRFPESNGLTSLDFASNQVTELHPSLRHLHALQRLDASRNAIVRMPPWVRLHCLTGPRNGAFQIETMT